MRRSARYVVAVVWFVGALASCRGQPGPTEEGAVPKSEAELQAIAADQRIRDAELAVRAMRPEERDLTLLLSLLGNRGLARWCDRLLHEALELAARARG